ncbi:MAG: hypothetical protein IAE78_20540 [Myxococcus sp.]|nr:hypothetical protein [Myxococcus sp.]
MRHALLMGLVGAAWLSDCGCAPAPTPSPAPPPRAPAGPWYCAFVRCPDAGLPPLPTSCTAGTCAGCCDQDGACQSGGSAFSCGRGGDRCRACNSREVCTSGACVPARAACGPGTCAGCCTADGFCMVGTQPLACGRNAGPCDRCDFEFECLQNQCVKPCNASTCAGCCDANGVCQQGASNGACGRGGVACEPCLGRTVCGSGRTCTAPAGCSTCRTGQCCLDNTCVEATVDRCARAGLPNAECRLCAAPERCGGGTEAGFCVRPGARPLASSCVWDGDCEARTPWSRPTCLVGLAWPTGYCSDACGPSTCAAPDVCGDTLGRAVCLKGCAVAGEACADAGSTRCEPLVDGGAATNACVPPCTPATAAVRCASGRCHGDGLCCGATGNVCCEVGAPCAGSSRDGGVSVCGVDGRCS